MDDRVRTLVVVTTLVLWGCGGEWGGAAVDPAAAALAVWREEWESGKAKVAFQYYLDPAGRPVMHGYYREYSHLVDGLVMRSGQFVDGVDSGEWYNRCSPGPWPAFTNGGFERGDFSGWKIDGGETNAVELVPAAGPGHGLLSARLTLTDNRVELVRTDPDSFLKERIYAWSFKLDRDFKDEPWWMVFCQFHSQPDFPRGETWDNYPEFRPPVSIAYGNGRARLLLIPLDQQTRTLGSFPVKKGEWFDVFLQIKWSLEEDGYIEMFVNDKPVTPFNGVDYKHFGPNLHNEVGNFLKIGLYRDRRATQVNSVYVDNLSIDDC